MFFTASLVEDFTKDLACLFVTLCLPYLFQENPQWCHCVRGMVYVKSARTG